MGNFWGYIGVWQVPIPPKDEKMLNDLKIKSAKPEEKDYKLFDEKGLFLHVKKSGGKLWRFKYRFEGKEKLLSIGSYPEISLAEAREKRAGARKQVVQGVDPSELKKIAKTALRGVDENSFEVVAREWIHIHLAKKSGSYDARVRRQFEKYVFPWLGKKSIQDIKAPEILTVVKRPQAQGKLETAHRTLQCMGQVFRYGVQKKL